MLENHLNSFVITVVGIFFFTNFLRCILSLSILRVALNLNISGMGIITLAVSILISFLLSGQEIQKLEQVAATTTTGVSDTLNSVAVEEIFRTQMESRLDPVVVKHLEGSLKSEIVFKPEKPNQYSFRFVSTAYVIGELKFATYLGLILILPMLVIDLIVVHIFTVLQYKSLPAEAVSFPLKLLLFLSVSGWEVLFSKLIG